MSAGRFARGAFPTLLRLAVSALLLGWLWTQLEGDWSEVRSLRPEQLVPAALVFALSTVLGAWQWTLILRRGGVAVGAGRLQALYWIGLFFNNFLPSNVGGDLVKVADVAVHTSRVARPLAGTLLDRMLGLCALVAVSFVAGGILGAHRPAGLPWWMLAVLGAGVLGLAAAMLSGRLGRLLRAMISRLRPSARDRLGELLDELSFYRADPAFIARIAGLALVVQSLRVATHVLVADAMGLSLGVERVLQLYVLVPVLGVAVVLPISFNGLGVRELVATRLMPSIGIGAESAAALQISTYLVQVAVSLLGGLVFAWMMLRGRIRLRRPASSGNPVEPNGLD